MKRCPKCGAGEGQVKKGRNPTGSQRYKCQACGRISTPTPTVAGDDQGTRAQAIWRYVEGLNLRRIGRSLGVNHQSVANGVNAYASSRRAAPVPEQVPTSELDELFTFVGEKKDRLPDHGRRPQYALHYRLGGGLGTPRRGAATTAGYSDLCRHLRFGWLSALSGGDLPRHPSAGKDKSQTYSVEATNAEFRPYLAGLARASRCFSRPSRPVPCRYALCLCLESSSAGQASLSRLSRSPLILCFLGTPHYRRPLQ